MAQSVASGSPPAQTPMTIVRLSAENIMRISAVEISPDGSPVVVIAGENEAGKSAVLAAIEMALGGEKRLPREPIRRGQQAGKVILDLGDIIVTRTFTAGGGTALKVTNREGAAYPSPQALLTGLVSKLTFDPLAFAEADEKTQAETLRQLAGINTDDLETERKRVYDERTLVNRDVTQLQGALAKAPRHPNVGLEPVNAADVAEQLRAADESADAATGVVVRAAEAAHAVGAARELAAARNDAVERARQALAEAETASLEADEALHAALQALNAANASAEQAKAQVPDRAALRQRIADVEAVNTKVRDNQAYQTLGAQLAEKKAAAEALTARLNTIEAEKAERLTSAAFPIEGLGLSDAGVTWNGLPFSQASTAIRIRVSCAIGFALNPKLKILRVRNGNDLGATNLKLLADAAAAVGGQCWIERIAGGDGLYTVVIEDGSVVATAGEAVTA